MTPVRRVILVDGELQNSLQPLLDRRPFALLPIANRPLIHYALTALRAADVFHVDLVVADTKGEVANIVGSGLRWSLSAKVWPAKSGDEQAIIRSITSIAKQPVIVISLTEALSDGIEYVLSTAWSNQGCKISPQSNPSTKRAKPLSAGDYWKLNMAALKRLPESNHIESNFGSYLIIGRHCRIAETVRFREPCLVGSNCHLKSRADIGRNTIIGEFSVIDKDVSLQRCLVLSGSYIAPSQMLINTIIDGERIIDFASATTQQEADRSIRAPIPTIFDRTTASSRSAALGASSL